MRRFVRSVTAAVGLSFRADAVRATAVWVLNIAAQLGGVVMLYLVRRLVDAALRGDQHEVTVSAVGIGAAAGASILAAWGGFTFGITLRERVGELIDRRVMELVLSAPGLEHHERPEHLDEIELLRTQRDQLSGSAEAVIHAAGLALSSAGSVALLMGIHPWLAVLPLAGLPSLLTGAAAERTRQRGLDDTAESRRLARHLLEVATTTAPAKELRIFGIGSAVADRQAETWRAGDVVLDRSAWRQAALATAGWVVFSAGFAVTIVFVAARGARGEVTPGQVVLALALAGQVNSLVTGAAATVGWLLASVRCVNRYLWLVDYAAEARRPPPEPVPPPDTLVEGITFENVSFRYPGTEVDVLTDVSVTLPAGATVAVVGDNGAGKSTLVKLLCRFYQPTGGRIAVDGVELARLEVAEWRERISAGFQDFARFELLASETVGVGDLPFVDDRGRIGDALERAAAADVVAALPAGLQTQLGRPWDQGVELSGGQWQKLALGRAMMRPAPLLLVLDEPTASLDAETEHALFERFAGAAHRVGAANGAITVLVSHRFSTVRMADLIVVVDGGRVAEVGSHDQLVRAKRLYAELYELQARAYR